VGEYAHAAQAPEAECFVEGLSRCHGGAGPPAGGGGPENKGDPALGRSRGGWRTTRHARCGAEADARALRVTAGQAGDAPVGEARLAALDPRAGIRPAALAKASDSTALRAQLDAKGSAPVLPPQAHRLESLGYDQAQ
jgi:hypothetical protein